VNDAPLHRSTRPSNRPSPWLMTPVLIAGTWLLSAQTPPSGAQLAALEARVAELEARISKAGNVTQIKAPFIVIGQDGQAVLEVRDAGRGTGSVVVSRQPGIGGVLTTMDPAGKAMAEMGKSATGGGGAIYTFNSGGKIASQISADGSVAVWNAAGDNVAVMASTKEGKGRFSVWDGQTRVVVIEDSAGAGNISLSKNGDGQAIARLGAGPGGSGRLTVMGPEGKIGAAVMGNIEGGGLVAVATQSGTTVAEVGVSKEGRGRVQVFKPGGGAVAVMSQGGPGDGGILQVANAGGVKATLATAEGGGGLLQLISTSGVPTVEAGTLASGRGTVRVGPFFKCSPITPSTPVIGIPGWTDCIVGSKDAK